MISWQYNSLPACVIQSRIRPCVGVSSMFASVTISKANSPVSTKYSCPSGCTKRRHLEAEDVLVSADVSDESQDHSAKTDLLREAGPRFITRGMSSTLNTQSVTCTPTPAKDAHQPDLLYREVLNEVTGLSLQGSVVSNLGP